MSKTFGLPGLRIGWIATKDRGFLRKIAAFKDFTTICNSAPGEFLSCLALKHKEILIERKLAIIRENLEHLDSFFEKHSELFEWLKPKAGPIGFPLLKFRKNAEEFCIDAVEKEEVMLLPGVVYDCGE